MGGGIEALFAIFQELEAKFRIAVPRQVGTICMVCPQLFRFCFFSCVIVLVFVRFPFCNFYFYIVFVLQIAIVLVFVLTERSAIVLVFVFVTKIALPTAGRLVMAYPTDCRSARPRTSRPTVRRTGRRTAGAGTAACCRQLSVLLHRYMRPQENISQPEKFLTWKKFTYSNGTSSVQTNIPT